jgi:hypothetical protein
MEPRSDHDMKIYTDGDRITSSVKCHKMDYFKEMKKIKGKRGGFIALQSL